MADSSLAALGPVDELRITLEIVGQDAKALTVLSFSGRDAISGLGSYDLTVGSSAAVAEKLDDALGQDVVFTIQKVGDEESLHIFRGVVDEVFPGGVAVGEHQRQTELRLVPLLHELTHVQNSHVFQNLTVTEIVAELVKPLRIEIDPRLSPEPLKRDYRTQVNERSFDFMARILAEEGIHFHVAHGKDTSTLVLVNDPRGFHPIEGKNAQIPYRDEAGAVHGEHIQSIRRERRVKPGSVLYRDYNFLKPTAMMVAGAAADGPSAVGANPERELYEYPGHFNAPRDEMVDVEEKVQGRTNTGNRRAHIRMQEQRSQALTFSGTSTSLRMRVGSTFTIRDHADAGFNRSYVITDASIAIVTLAQAHRTSGSAAGAHLHFVAAPADVAIRPVVPPKPKAHLRTARVVGPKADEPNVDEFGRVRIQFMWDRVGTFDDKSSQTLQVVRSSSTTRRRSSLLS